MYSIRLLPFAVFIFSSSASNVLPLHRRTEPSNATSLTATELATVFDVEVKFGDQSFLLQLDTGSSDTWVVQTGYECFNVTDNTQQLPQQACTYANITYDISNTFEPIQNQTFGVEYGVGIATGIVGYEEVTLGGITIQRQEVGIVNKATNPGDGMNSGVIGFGYPSLTSAHAGTTVANGSDSLLLNRIQYNTLFTNMYKQGLVDPYFSLAIDRLPPNISSGPGGYLGLGSLPPVAHDTTFAKAPVEITNTIPASFTNGTKEITEWTLTVDSISYGGNHSHFAINTPFQAVVDSGNPLNILPLEMADAVNKAFSPPAVTDASAQIGSGQGIYVVDCNAIAPTFGVTIGGQIFYHNGRDLILPDGDNTCISTIGAVVPTAGISLAFLGDAFLKNVVAVFDFGKNEMRFAARNDSGTATSNNASATATGSASSGSSTSTSSGTKRMMDGLAAAAATVGLAVMLF
jgi:hypothetical protein